MANQQAIKLDINNAAAVVRKVTWWGMVVNVALFAVKMAAGIMGNSQALVADAVHSLSDCTTDVIVLVGAYYWTRPPDENHPYGHGRIETMVTIIIGAALALVAIGIGYNAMHTFDSPHPKGLSLFTLGAALLSIFTKEGLFRWTANAGRRVKSTALAANAWHHRSDALSSIPVVIAIGISILFPQLVWLDHLGAIVVSLFILYAAWEILRPSILELTDASASKKVRNQIESIAASVEGVLDVHALRTRTHAGVTQVDMHILVDPGLTVHSGHEIAHEVHERLVEQIDDVVDVLVHVEPFESEHQD